MFEDRPMNEQRKLGPIEPRRADYTVQIGLYRAERDLEAIAHAGEREKWVSPERLANVSTVYWTGSQAKYGWYWHTRVLVSMVEVHHDHPPRVILDAIMDCHWLTRVIVRRTATCLHQLLLKRACPL